MQDSINMKYRLKTAWNIMTVSYKYIYFGARSLDIYAIEPTHN